MSEHNEELEQEQQEENLRPQDKDEGEFVKIPKKDHENMRKQLKKANGEAKTYREQLQQYRQYADDPNDLEELVALKQKFEEGDGANGDNQDEDAYKQRLESQLAKQRKELERSYKTQLEKAQEERKQLESTLENTVLLQQAESAVLKEKGAPALVLDEIRRRTKVIKDGDRFVTRVVDETGEVDFNDRGEMMTLDDLVQTLKSHDIFGRAFDAPAKSGSGMRNQNDNAEGRSSKNKFGDLRRGDLKGSKRQAFLDEHGEEAFFALKP